MQRLLTQAEAAEILCLSERTLERFRVSGTGPKFVCLGRSIRYRPTDIEAYIASRVVSSTSEQRKESDHDRH
jgi:predicted DNA-binding transcriptional regulator AlpA